jgi:hexosaminidase
MDHTASQAASPRSSVLVKSRAWSGWIASALLGASLTASSGLIYAQASQQPVQLMPLPASSVRGSGSLPVDGGFNIVFEGYREERLDLARDRFLARLGRRTGILRWPVTTASTPRLVIKTSGMAAPVQELGEDESYRLEVTPRQVLLIAPNPLGVLHGLQTLLQLVQTSSGGYIVPAIRIDDRPRFPWRGLMIDVGRHFMPLDVIRQNLDLMEAAKLNVFHWHLSEDQGFRIESKTFPLLQLKGSDGQFYTQTEVRDLLAYAKDRGIRVVPEFDMPGHSQSWFVGYPELASGSGPYHIERKWGIFDPAMNPARESTYKFLDSLIQEMSALFPDAYFHMGGDECNGKEWDANPRIQQFMEMHHLKDDAALQAYFTGRVQQLITNHHKITVGWDEVLQPDTPKDVVIQSWRGQDSLAAAARQGNRGLLSWGYYLDLNEPAGQHFAVDPMGKSAARLSPKQQARILGGEAAEWTEYLTPELLTGRVWPRAAAVAERLWSPQSDTDQQSMYERLAVFQNDLAWYGVTPDYAARPVFQRLASTADTGPLEVLANVVEPTKEYTREELGSYDAYTPLNRMVDAVPAESTQARIFHALAQRIASGSATAADLRQAHEWLDQWAANDSKLKPQLIQSALTAELVPVSGDLSRAAKIGLIALDAMSKQQAMSVAAQSGYGAELKRMEAPRAVLLDQTIPSIEILVQAARR